jgi:hypothetical protein
METSNPKNKPIDLDLDALLHPAQAFGHPRDVVNDPDLTLNEKRAILASWASDACAIEAAPALRRAPGGARPVSIDEILEALRSLDKEAHGQTESTAGSRRPPRMDRENAREQARPGRSAERAVELTIARGATRLSSARRVMLRREPLVSEER